MNKVDVHIDASASNYWALLEFTDKTGTLHSREIKEDHDGTVNGNLILAATQAMKALLKPCMIDIHTKSEYIAEPFRNGWINNWEKHEWRNAKGRIVRNAEAWKALRDEMARHSVRFLYAEEKRRRQ